MTKRLLMAMLCVRTSEARHGVLDLEVSSSKLMCQSKQRRTPSLKSYHLILRTVVVFQQAALYCARGQIPWRGGDAGLRHLVAFEFSFRLSRVLFPYEGCSVRVCRSHGSELSV